MMSISLKSIRTERQWRATKEQFYKLVERISKPSFELQMVLLDHDFVEKMSGSYG